MSTPVAIIGLTYAGTDIQTSDLGIFLTITQGLNEAPEARGKDYIVPHADGQVARNRRADRLDILLAGHVMGDGVDTAARRSDYRTNVRTLRLLFVPDRDPANLVATLEDGSVWTIAARPNGSPAYSEQVPSEFAYVSVQLLSVAPDWTIDEGGS